jgi:hypothetical protein
MEVLKALQMLATVDLKTDNEAERTAKVKSLRVVDEQLTQPLLRTTNEFDKLLEFGVYALLRMLQDSDMNVWSLAEQVLVKTVKVLESSHRDKIVTEVWKGVKGSRVEGRSRRFAIELFALYSHRIKPSKADKFREALLRNLVSIARQEDDQLLQEALSKCIDPIITHQLAHAPLADLDPFLDELAANVRSTQGRVRRSAVICIVSLCKGHKQHLDLFVASVRRMLNLILINASGETSSMITTATAATAAIITTTTTTTNTTTSQSDSSLLIDLPEYDAQSVKSTAAVAAVAATSTTVDSSSSSAFQPSTPPAVPQEIPLKPELIRKPITDLDLSDKLHIAIAKSSSPTLQGVLHAFRQLLRLNIEFVQNDLYAMPNPMNADLGTFARIASQCLIHDDNNVTVAALELLQEIFENNWQPLVQLGGTGFKSRPEKDEITAFVEDIVGKFELMLFDQSLRISVQVLVVACFCSLSVPLPIPLQICLKKRISQFIDLLKHSDPLLRGQAYYFIGCFMCGWLQAKSRIDWPELDVFELLGTILHSTMQDDSAIAAKMACEGLSICTEPLLASEYAFFVPYMLQHLMCLPSDAYLLLKSKTFSLMSKIDYRMISYLEKSMKKLKASDYKPGTAGNPIQTTAVNLLGEGWLEDVKNSASTTATASSSTTTNPTTSAPSSSSSVVRLPVHLTIGSQKLQNSVVDFLISFLQDQDARVRHKAGSVLVKLVPHLNYSHFFDTAERRQYVVALRILDMQTSQHMSDERNNEWKEHTDWLLWKLVPKINQAVESLFLKGFYHFLRVLLEKGYTLPGQLVGIMLDQLACSNLAIDLDTQLDVFIMMSHLVKHLTGSLASYTQRIFVHVLRILHILSAILSSKPIPSFKETKPGTEKELPAGAVQGQPQYLQLWEKLQDTYRLSLTSLHGNLFDEFCISSIKAVALIASAMGKGVVPYIEEVIGYVNDHFERNTEDVLECIQALLEAALSDVDLVQERGISTVLEPLPNTDEPLPEAHIHNIVDLTTPNYESLLHPVLPTLRKAKNPLRSRRPLRSPSAQTLTDAQAAVAREQKKKIFKMFEPTLKRCIDHYLCTQAVHRRRTILQLLTHIISSLRLVLDYRSLDRDASFIRQVHGHLMRTSALHNEIIRSKTGGPAPSTGAWKQQATGEAPSTPKTPARNTPAATTTASPLGMSTDSASATASSSTLNEGTALQLSEIAATQLAFLFEMLFHCGISWNGADLMGLIPLAFTSSWQPAFNQTAFEYIANILFTENLLKQWRECPRHHSLGRPPKVTERGSAPPASTLTRTNSSSQIAPLPVIGTPSKDTASGTQTSSATTTSSSTNASTKEEWINDAILGNMRNQFVTQLLMLLPDPRAINLLAKVLDLLQGFKNSSPYLEISSVIHDGLITILLDEGTTVLFAKSSISDLLAMFTLIDRLPTETLNLNAIAATFVSISKYSLHHIGLHHGSTEPSIQEPILDTTPNINDFIIESATTEIPIISFETATPISAIPRSLKGQFGLNAPSTPVKGSSRPPSRPLTPADLGIVSPLPVSPAHKEETLRERSKRRVVEHERRYYAAHDRAWLPRCAFLLRILSRFSETQILAALKNPMKTDLAEMLPSDADLDSPEAMSHAFALLLTSLLERGTHGLGRGVSADYYEDWTRQVCILTHLITYIVDSPARKETSSKETKLEKSPSQQDSSSSTSSSSLPIVSSSPSRPTTNGGGARTTINFFDDLEDSGEVDLLITKAQRKQYHLPEAMAQVISTLNITNMLYGAVQSKFSAVAFSLCKLFQNLHLPEALQALLKFSTPTPTKSAKVSSSSSSSGGGDSVGAQSTSSSSSLGQSSGMLTQSAVVSSLPWTWFREVLHMASFSAFCRVTCSSATKAELSARREVIANLLNNHDHLERITHQAHNADIKRLFTIYPISAQQQNHIISYVLSKMERNRIKETLEPQNIHQLLLLSTYLPATEQMLNLLLDYFMTSTYISVVIATEQYFISLLSRLEITITPLAADGSEPLEVLVKRLLSSRQPHMRVTFCKKLAKSGWLINLDTTNNKQNGSNTTNQSNAVSSSSSSSGFSSALSPSNDLLGLAIPSSSNSSSSPISSATTTSQSPIQPRSADSPQNLIEDFIMEHISSRKHSSAELIELLCSSMASPTLFRRMLQMLGPQPMYLAHCLADPQCSNVKEDILLAIASTLNDWFTKNAVMVSPELDEMLTHVEDQTHIGRRNPKTEPTPNYPDPEDPTMTHIYSEDWRANVELLKLVVSAIEQFGDHPVLSISSTSSTSESSSNSSVDLLSSSSSSSSPSNQSHLETDKAIEGNAIKKAFGGAALVCLASNSLRKLLILHETKTSVLSSFDVVVAMNAMKHLFHRHRFSMTDLKQHPQLRKLIYRLYSCYFILFRPSKKLILDYSSSVQVPEVLNFFFDIIRTLATRATEAEVVGWNQEQLLYYEVLQQLLKSSPSLEYATYPLQDDPINFDYNNEPVQLLSQFCHLINNIHFNYASTFSAVWKQLMEGMDEEIAAVATSEAIKVVTIRSMTSMILRAGYKATHITYESRSSSTGERGFNLGIPLLSLEMLRSNNASSSPKFLGLDISNMLTVFINTVLKPLIETYVKCTTNEPAVGKECLKSLTLLSDHFTNSQWMWLHEYVFSILDQQTNIWDEDPLMRNYLLVSAAKSTAVLLPSLLSSSSSGSSSSHNNLPVASKLQKLLVFHIQNMKLRESEIHAEDKTVMPMAKNLILIALHYVIQAKTLFDVRADSVIWPWLELCAKSPTPPQDANITMLLASTTATSPSQQDQRILNTSALVRFLAKTCESLIPTSKEVEGRERAQAMTQQQINQNEDDFDMAHMEEIKTLFASARKNSKSHPTQLYADDLVRSLIPHKMMQYFSAETIISNLLAELSKPEAGAQSIAFVLHQVILRLHATLADNLDDMLSKWILMTLPHFTVNSPQRMPQAQWSLTSLFLSSSRNPVLRTLFHELTKTSETAITPLLFVVAGLDFYCNRNLDTEAKAEFLSAFNVPNNQLFQSLHLQLQAIQPRTTSTDANQQVNLLD